MRSIASRAGAASLVLHFACSSSVGDDIGGDDFEHRVKPKGTTTQSGFRVEVPPGASAVEPAMVIPSNTGGEVPVGTTLECRPGSYDVHIHTRSGWFDTSPSAMVDVEPEQTTTVTGAVLAPKALNGRKTLGLSADTFLTLSQSRWDGVRSAGAIDRRADGTRGFLVPEGSYEINFGLADGIPVEIAAGESRVESVFVTKHRRIARLVAPKRELPDACEGASTWRVSLVDADHEWPSREVRLEDGQEVDVGLSPWNADRTYVFDTLAGRQIITLDVGDPGAPREMRVGRIDVDDVFIDGGSTKVRGTYRIDRVDPSTDRTLTADTYGCPEGEAETNTGFDVAPGRYRVEVRYVPPGSSISKIDVHTVDVP